MRWFKSKIVGDRVVENSIEKEEKRLEEKTIRELKNQQWLFKEFTLIAGKLAIATQLKMTKDYPADRLIIDKIDWYYNVKFKNLINIFKSMSLDNKIKIIKLCYNERNFKGDYEDICKDEYEDICSKFIDCCLVENSVAIFSDELNSIKNGYKRRY